MNVFFDRILGVHILNFPLTFQEFLPFPVAVEFTVLVTGKEIALTHNLTGVIMTNIFASGAKRGILLLLSILFNKMIIV